MCVCIQSVMDELLRSLKSKDQQQLDAWLHKEEWATVEQLISAHGLYATSITSSTHFALLLL